MLHVIFVWVVVTLINTLTKQTDVTENCHKMTLGENDEIIFDDTSISDTWANTLSMPERN